MSLFILTVIVLPSAAVPSTYNVIKSGKSTDPQSLGKEAGEEILKKAGKNFIKKRWILFLQDL